jgi:hypothetical protein
MRIELRDQSRHRVGRVRIEDAAQPTRVTTDAGHEVYLTWESAVDDSGRLRRCVACGCSDLFQEKAFPQVTGIVVVLAFAGAIAGVLGFATNLPVLTAMTIVLVLDVGILLFSQRRLVCYRCRTSYHELEIARYHRSWDRAVADRHPQSKAQSEATDSPSTSPPARMKRAGYTI